MADERALGTLQVGSMSTSTSSQMFPALLRYWRTRRGLSQLELALESDVSARHISFLESGRARPSEEMVLRLFSVMSVPLSNQNQALSAAGFEPWFPSPAADALAPEVDQALTQMMAQHEPFPLAVLSVDGVVLRQNRGAARLFKAFIASPDALPEPLDMFSLLFDPRLMRSFILDWHVLARSIASRLHREHLHRGDARLGAVSIASSRRRRSTRVATARLLRRRSAHVALAPRARRAPRGLSRYRDDLLDTSAGHPRQSRIESCFPLDDGTREACVRLAERGDA